MPSALTPRRRPSRTFSVVTVVLSVCALGFVVLVGLSSALATPTGSALATPTGTLWRGPGPIPIRSTATEPPLGLPSIQPRAALVQAGGAGPYYTEADVRQYVATHRPPFTVPGTPNPVVVSVQFITAQQASAQLGGESMDVSDSTLVCLVYVSGIFVDTDGPIGPTATVTPFTQGWMVFDAHTGNLLVSDVG
jgi:hypothetical protein